MKRVFVVTIEASQVDVIDRDELEEAIEREVKDIITEFGLPCSDVIVNETAQ